ncbi:hypothetical protein P4679_30815 [Priestia megaterium]|uniref:hypothetical protein n=1 Tax=Priestia megaterium TaxID=1404 RepID=UPI002E1E039D|nr:hypothetical protein [Priestia megaterium]
MTNLEDCTMGNLQEALLENGYGFLGAKMPTILENPVIKEFLEDENHEELFNRAVNHPSEETYNELSEAFITFHRRNRVIRYCSGFIRRYPIDYDKRIKLKRKRFRSVPANTFEVSPEVWVSDVYNPSLKSVEDEVIKREQHSKGFVYAKNDSLNTAINSLLNEKQKKIFLLLSEGYSSKEIAEMFGDSEPNITYWKKKMIKQLKEHFNR